MWRVLTLGYDAEVPPGISDQLAKWSGPPVAKHDRFPSSYTKEQKRHCSEEETNSLPRKNSGRNVKSSMRMAAATVVVNPTKASLLEEAEDRPQTPLMYENDG